MTLLTASRASLFRSSLPLRAGGGKLTPRWNIPEADYHKYTFQPTIPDKHFGSAHVHYSPFTLWYRSQRPYLERIGGSVQKTLFEIYNVSIGWAVQGFRRDFVRIWSSH